MKILFVIGTRPEAIKLCPVIRHFRESKTHNQICVCITAQHRQLSDQVLRTFDVMPNYDLNIMRRDQTPIDVTGRMLLALDDVLSRVQPQLIIVQGDTCTAMSAAMAGFYSGIPIAHVEAGLRTYDPTCPFPEEMNRVLISKLAAAHLAPTERAASNLEVEGIARKNVSVTGNSGIDALLYVRQLIAQGVVRSTSRFEPCPGRRLVLVTTHRRESVEALAGICNAVKRLAKLPKIEIAIPVHPNPKVKEKMVKNLRGVDNVRLLEPLDYVSFVSLLERVYLVLTDSGGIQEEAPSLGKPTVILRNKTDRPEAIEAQSAILAGTDEWEIERVAASLLRDEDLYWQYSRVRSVYGDGRASVRIYGFVKSHFTSQWCE